MPAITSAAPGEFDRADRLAEIQRGHAERGHRDRRGRQAREPGLDIGQAAIPQPQADDAGGERIPDSRAPTSPAAPTPRSNAGSSMSASGRDSTSPTRLAPERQPQRPVGRRQALAEQHEARLAQHRAADEQIAEQRRGAGRRAGRLHQHKARHGQRNGRGLCTRQPVADHDDAQQRHHGGQGRGDDAGIGGCCALQALEHQHREADHAQQRHEHQVALLSERHLPAASARLRRLRGAAARRWRRRSGTARRHRSETPRQQPCRTPRWRPVSVMAASRDKAAAGREMGDIAPVMPLPQLAGKDARWMSGTPSQAVAVIAAIDLGLRLRGGDRVRGQSWATFHRWYSSSAYRPPGGFSTL